MKKIISILLLLSFCFSFTACGKSEPKEISCEEIIVAYEDAGYTVKYHNHSEPNTESDVICHIQIYDPNNPESNYLYIDRYSDAEKAEKAAKEGEYNIAIWVVFAITDCHSSKH